jgi:hypothetical protein
MNCDFDKSSQQEADQDRRLGKLANFGIHDAQVPGPKINADRNGSGTYATILRGEVKSNEELANLNSCSTIPANCL